MSDERLRARFAQACYEFVNEGKRLAGETPDEAGVIAEERFSGVDECSGVIVAHVEGFDDRRGSSEIRLTCHSFFPIFQARETVYSIAHLDAKTARDLAAHLISLADKLEGKAE